MTIRTTLIASSLIAASLVSGAAQAVAITGQGTWESTLQGRDLDGNLATFEAYYDTSLNITWLADANYAYTTGYSTWSNGRMNWSTANAWAASLNPYGSGITGWRLPTTVDVGNNGCIYPDVDCGYNITTHSEMSHMFFVTLGDKAMYSASGAYQPDFGLTNTGPFSNVQSDWYWSGTGVTSSIYAAWLFTFNDGAQYYDGTAYGYYAWAVHAGDVGAVPEAHTYAMMLAGLGLVGFMVRLRKQAEV